MSSRAASVEMFSGRISLDLMRGDARLNQLCTDFEPRKDKRRFGVQGWVSRFLSMTVCPDAIRSFFCLALLMQPGFSKK